MLLEQAFYDQEDMANNQKIGLGGGCHWCTEAVFLSLKGVQKVEQGFIAPHGEDSSFSEAVLVYYDAGQITLKDLFSIHLHTHKSISERSMRSKYRSAVYALNPKDEIYAIKILEELQIDFVERLITQVLSFKAFELSNATFHNYYFSDVEKPFCTAYINPKLKVLREKYSEHLNEKINI